MISVLLFSWIMAFVFMPIVLRTISSSLPFFDNYFLGEHQHLRRVAGLDAPD